jgi:hypothetical protein
LDLVAIGNAGPRAIQPDVSDFPLTLATINEHALSFKLTKWLADILLTGPPHLLVTGIDVMNCDEIEATKEFQPARDN